jgi:uncharacterized small protein (DUF1192 family)
MTFEDEPAPKKKRLLDEMSINELKERITALREEIGLCEAAITKKEATKLAADAAFFKKA